VEETSSIMEDMMAEVTDDLEQSGVDIP